MNNDESIIVKLALKEKEYIRFFLYMKMKTSLIILTCGFFLYILVFYVLTGIPLLMNMTLSALVILFLVIPLALVGLIYKAKKEFRSNYSLSEEVLLEINDIGFNLTTAQECTHQDWNYFYSVRELKKDFALYYSAYTAFTLPKRCFTSKKDINLFKELISKHIISDKVYLKK